MMLSLSLEHSHTHVSTYSVLAVNKKIWWESFSLVYFNLSAWCCCTKAWISQLISFETIVPEDDTDNIYWTVNGLVFFLFPTLTYKTPERFFLGFTSQSKISQLCIHVGQINDNIFWLDISVQDTLFLALNRGIKNLRKKSSSIVFSHPVIDVHDVKQVRRIFGTFQHINEIFFVGENVQELNDVWMTNVALVVSFNGELLAIDLQREKDLSKSVSIL